MLQLDSTDLAIFNLLVEDGRASNKSIAQALDLTEFVVASRIRAMRQSNAVQIVLQQNILHDTPNGVVLLVEIMVDNPDHIAAASRAMAQLPQVVSLYETAMRPEIIAYCRVDLPSHVSDFSRTLLANVPGIAQLAILPIIEMRRFRTELSFLGGRTVQADAEDDPWPALLRRDGRQSVSELARTMNLSETATRQRLAKLLAKPGHRISAVCDVRAIGLDIWADIRVTVAPQRLDEAMTKLASLGDVTLVSHLSGRANLGLFVAVRTVADLDRFITQDIRTIPGMIDFKAMRVTKAVVTDYALGLSV